MHSEIRDTKLTFVGAVILLVVLDALFLWPYAYRHGYGHGDVQSMEFALFWGLKNRELLPHFAYGRDFSFGWYYLLSGLVKLLNLKPDNFPWSVNLLATFASTVTSICLLGFLSKFFSLTVALVAAILWRFVPEVWELSTYAHPWTIALPFFAAGTWIYVAKINIDRPLNGWKFYLSCAFAAALMTMSLCIRADMVFFMPLVVALTYLHRRDAVLPLTTTMASSLVSFLIIRHFVVGGARPSVIDYVANFARFDNIPINLALVIYPISGYLLMIVTKYLLTNRSNSIHTASLAIWSAALAPNLLFWLPIGPCLRHFAPLYLMVSVLCGYLLTKRPRVISLSVASLILSNMLVAEIGFRIFSPIFPSRFVQIGVQRRVMESIPLGIPWLNHEAQRRLNELNERYSLKALDYLQSPSSPVIFVQANPYRLLTLAIDRSGTVKRIKDEDGKIKVWQLGSSRNSPWCVDIPDDAGREWLKSLQSFARSHNRKLRFLGPRVPKAISTILNDQAIVKL